MREGRLPFEVSYVELTDDIDFYVERVFDAIKSDYLADFLVLPRGSGFVSSRHFVEGYEALVDATECFRALDADALFNTIAKVPMALIVIRTILGLSPPEWASLASAASDERIDQGFARNLDRSIRTEPTKRIGQTPLQRTRIRALVSVACEMLTEGVPDRQANELHRLEKVDTRGGLGTLAKVARDGVRYESLLYERFLGRPFASHRDSVSELVGGMLEDRIEDHLASTGIVYHGTNRGESVPGWDQNPDFFCPEPGAPTAVIEAKMTNDDGTARDKIARVLRLAEMRDSREREYRRGFAVIACIAGRGFAIRKSDMKDLLFATRGKVFTLSQIDRLADCAGLTREGQ